MRAIRFEAFGDPSVLQAVEVPAPVADEKTSVVRVMAASINPSDLKNVAGAMSQTTLPRIPGRDFAGVRRGRSVRLDRRRGLGHGRRCRLYPRRNPCRADRRAGGEPAPQARRPSASTRRRRSASITWPPGAASKRRA